jgi:hypothetical protein
MNAYGELDGSVVKYYRGLFQRGIRLEQCSETKMILRIPGALIETRTVLLWNTNQKLYAFS